MQYNILDGISKEVEVEAGLKLSSLAREVDIIVPHRTITDDSGIPKEPQFIYSFFHFMAKQNI